MYRIKNTADDRSKHLLHRTAAKFELEPSLGGYRIRLGSYYDITDEHYARVKPVIDEWVKKGMVEVFPVLPDGYDARKFVTDPEYVDGLQLGGPTLEEWTAAGYSEDNYPPHGYAEVFSPGLVAFRRAQEATQEAARKADEAIKKAREAFTQLNVLEQIPPNSIVIMEEPPPSQPPVIEAVPVQTPVSVTVPPASTTPSLNKNKKLR